MTRTRILGGLAVAVLAALGWIIFGSANRTPSAAIAGITVPDLSGAAAEGAELFAGYCIECHGEDAAGSDNGPPLIHKYYEPNHHPDQAFLVAALYGVRQHHWTFGSMKPVEGISQDQVIKIITFVRAVQRANGIE